MPGSSVFQVDGCCADTGFNLLTAAAVSSQLLVAIQTLGSLPVEYAAFDFLGGGIIPV